MIEQNVNFHKQWNESFMRVLDILFNLMKIYIPSGKIG